MRLSTAVGLLLRSDEEREILHAAALECGLEPVDLTAWGPNEAAGSGTHHRPVMPTDDLQLHLIVTDRKLAENQSFDVDNSALTILVRDEKQADGNPAEGSNTTEQDAAYAWVLYRPLQTEVVAAQLRQAARASRNFAKRYCLMFEKLHLSHRILDSLSNGVTICDAGLPDLPLVYVNPAFERITGYPAHETCGRNCRFLHGSDTDQPGLTKIREAIREVREARVLLRNYRKDGTLFWNEFYLSPILDLAGQLTHFVGIQNDVTARVESSLRLDYLAHHDVLTGLANRGLLMEQLKQALLRTRRSGGNIAVLFFDLDNFKHVNDVLGHEAGDSLLQVVAERLRAGARAGETVARLGGDEFVVVLEGLSDQQQPTDVMQRLASSVGAKVHLVDQEFFPSVSVGMALFPRDGDTPKALLKAADSNMYIAKHQTKPAK
jgi:diguanylate cyclase (GGDEF)-like protein/PAS domain S-box-containing protein